MMFISVGVIRVSNRVSVVVMLKTGGGGTEERESKMKIGAVYYLSKSSGNFGITNPLQFMSQKRG